MAVVFHRSPGVLLWASVLCVVILASPSPLLPSSFTMLLVIAAMVSMIVGFVRWLASGGRRVAVLPVAGAPAPLSGLIVDTSAGAICVRTLQPTREVPTEEADDAMDLLRMDDDGGWRKPCDRP